MTVDAVVSRIFFTLQSVPTLFPDETRYYITDSQRCMGLLFQQNKSPSGRLVCRLCGYFVGTVNALCLVMCCPTAVVAYGFAHRRDTRRVCVTAHPAIELCGRAPARYCHDGGDHTAARAGWRITDSPSMIHDRPAQRVTSGNVSPEFWPAKSPGVLVTSTSVPSCAAPDTLSFAP
jgi:hypothetical protein